MGRPPRDHQADRRAIEAAADRLLAGTPLRSTTGKLTATELITESGLRRDVVYEHGDLTDTFKARVKARNAVPEAMRELTDRCTQLHEQLQKTKTDLARAREVSSYLRRVIAELSIELDQSRQEDHATPTVPRLRSRSARKFHTPPC
ncbi:hypothetical protein JWS13_03525 (plasmid) [Rhodococcus pseudokoreensis]|uniref:Mobilization protein n=1 Tax=Rhodococcus pseudokoreensis TaxID=2811421 RepID=A0A974VYW0_9NOCA|nr:hypothetical protein JWS13_03525 [Rhodococcus pseudokoreensis]